MVLTREEIGRRLAQAREAVGLSQSRVAEYLSINRESVSRMENGHRPVDLPTLHKLTDLYGISLSQIFGANDSSDDTMPTIVNHNAFRAHDLSVRDLETISWITRIAMNLDDLNKLSG